MMMPPPMPGANMFSGYDMPMMMGGMQPQFPYMDPNVISNFNPMAMMDI